MSLKQNIRKEVIMRINTNNGEKLRKASTPVCDKRTYIKSTIFCSISKCIGMVVVGCCFLIIPFLIGFGMWSFIVQKFDRFWTIMIFPSTYVCLMCIYFRGIIIIFDLMLEKVLYRIDAVLCNLINIDTHIGLKYQSCVAIRNM